MAGWRGGRDRLEEGGLSYPRNRVERDGIARVIPPRVRQESESRVSEMQRNPANETWFPAFRASATIGTPEGDAAQSALDDHPWMLQYGGHHLRSI